MELVKPSPSTSFGFSIAGGLSAENYDGEQEAPEGIYVTHLLAGGLAEANGQMQPGDQLMRVSQAASVLNQ